MRIVKDISVKNLLSKLDLSGKGWKIIDHWDADLCAVGITSECAQGKLVYISTFGKATGTYDYECEYTTGTPDLAGFRTVASGKDVSLITLESVLERWLSCSEDPKQEKGVRFIY